MPLLIAEDDKSSPEFPGRRLRVERFAVNVAFDGELVQKPEASCAADLSTLDLLLSKPGSLHFFTDYRDLRQTLMLRIDGLIFAKLSFLEKKGRWIARLNDSQG
jgi:hypothetical protein